MTILKMASISAAAMQYGMLTRNQFLEAVRASAKSQAEIARVLNVSEPAVSLIFKHIAESDPTKGKPRDLSYDEAVKLSDYYGIDPNKLTVEKLIPVLRMCLASPPSEWSDRTVERFAEDLIFGIELLRTTSSIEPNPGMLEVASRALADRRRRRRGEEDI